MYFSSNAAASSFQSSHQPTLHSRVKMEAGESLRIQQQRMQRPSSPLVRRPASQYSSSSGTTHAAYASRSGLNKSAKVSSRGESKLEALQDASEKHIVADQQCYTASENKQVLMDLLRQPPIVLEVSQQDCEDYIQDTTWPFNELRKGTLLGRGGFSVVWLATDASNNRVAVKQVARRGQAYQGEIEAAKSEIIVAEMLSQNDFHHRGHKYIASLLRAVETRRGIWIVQEYGGIPLSKLLFETTGVSHNGGRIYDVKHLPFLQILQRDDRVMRKVLKQILFALDLLTMNNVVHSDLKPDNILAGLSDDEEFRIRICDFGSAFVFNEEKEQRPFATPEYMPPEALKANCFGGFRTSVGNSVRGGRSDVVDKKGYPWSFDMWSLGCIWLEILHGVPLWIPFDCRLPSRRIVKGGLFGVKRRDPARIIANQEAVLKDLPIIWKRAHRLGEPNPAAQSPATGSSHLSGACPPGGPLWGASRANPVLGSRKPVLGDSPRHDEQLNALQGKSGCAAACSVLPSSGKSMLNGLTLIKRMLAVNPRQRIAPTDAINAL